MIKKALLIILLSFIITGFALAQDTELEYPEVGGEEIGEGLGDYLNYVFTFAIALAGVITFAGLVYGGFKYLTSRGNPAVMSSARNQMLGAIIGLILLLGSYILLNTINPDLVKLPWKEEKPQEGICFYNDKKEKKCFVKSSKSFPEDFEATKIEFGSSIDELPLVFVFSDENYQGTPDLVFNKDGSQSVSISAPASFFLFWQEYGARLYTKTRGSVSGGLNFEEFPNEPYQSYKTSAADIGKYKGKVKAIDFNAPCHEEYGKWFRDVNYGAVLHSETDFEGECAIVFGEVLPGCTISGEKDKEACCPRVVWDLSAGSDQAYIHPSSFGNDSAHSITLFNYDSKKPETGRITFYDRPNQAGDHFTVEAEDIEEEHGDLGYYWRVNNLDYPIQGNVNGAEVEEGRAETDNEEMEEIISFKIEGRFMVVLTQEENFSSYCEVFKRSVPSLEGHHVIHEPWDARVHSIMIIPLREPVGSY